jgi:hypothetical protein
MVADLAATIKLTRTSTLYTERSSSIYCGSSRLDRTLPATESTTCPSLGHAGCTDGFPLMASD